MGVKGPSGNSNKEPMQMSDGGRGYRIPESRSAFCRIVSFTAANTSRTFPVSVACVKLEH